MMLKRNWLWGACGLVAIILLIQVVQFLIGFSSFKNNYRPTTPNQLEIPFQDNTSRVSMVSGLEITKKELLSIRREAVLKAQYAKDYALSSSLFKDWDDSCPLTPLASFYGIDLESNQEKLLALESEWLSNPQALLTTQFFGIGNFNFDQVKTIMGLTEQAALKPSLNKIVGNANNRTISADYDITSFFSSRNIAPKDGKYPTLTLMITTANAYDFGYQQVRLLPSESDGAFLSPEATDPKGWSTWASLSCMPTDIEGKKRALLLSNTANPAISIDTLPTKLTFALFKDKDMKSPSDLKYILSFR